jgi:hypothetical protein
MGSNLEIIQSASEKYNVPESVLYAVISQESNFDPKALGPEIRGRHPEDRAMGLMQLMPATAKELGVTDPYDPRQNVDGGARYLRSLLDRFDNDVDKAVIAYHQGAERTRRNNGQPVGPNTIDYHKKVMGKIKAFAQHTGLPEIPKPPVKATTEQVKEAAKIQANPIEKHPADRSIIQEAWDYLLQPGDFRAGMLVEGTKDVARNSLIARAAKDINVGIKSNQRRSVRFKEIQKLRAKTEPGFVPSDAVTQYADVEDGKEKLRAALVNEWLQGDPTLSDSTGWIDDILRTSPQLVAQIFATVTTGPMGGGLFMGSQIMGAKYLQALENGADHETAMFAAVADALMQAPLEQLGIGKAAKFLPLREKIVGKLLGIAGSAGREGLTELLQAYPDHVTNLFSKEPDKGMLNAFLKTVSDPKEWAELKKEGAQGGVVGTIMGAGSGTAGAVFGKKAPGRSRSEQEIEDLVEGDVQPDTEEDVDEADIAEKEAEDSVARSAAAKIAAEAKKKKEKKEKAAAKKAKRTADLKGKKPKKETKKAKATKKTKQETLQEMAADAHKGRKSKATKEASVKALGLEKKAEPKKPKKAAKPASKTAEEILKEVKEDQKKKGSGDFPVPPMKKGQKVPSMKDLDKKEEKAEESDIDRLTKQESGIDALITMEGDQTVKQLRAYALKNGIKPKGKKKADILDSIRAAEAAKNQVPDDTVISERITNIKKMMKEGTKSDKKRGATELAALKKSHPHLFERERKPLTIPESKPVRGKGKEKAKTGKLSKTKSDELQRKARAQWARIQREAGKSKVAAEMDDATSKQIASIAQRAAERANKPSIAGDIVDQLLNTMNSPQYKKLKTDKGRDNFLRRAASNAAISKAADESRRGVGKKGVAPVVSGSIDIVEDRGLDTREDVDTPKVVKFEKMRTMDDVAPTARDTLAQIQILKEEIEKETNETRKKSKQKAMEDLKKEFTELSKQEAEKRVENVSKRKKDKLIEAHTKAQEDEADRWLREQEEALAELRERRDQKPEPKTETQQKRSDIIRAKKKGIEETRIGLNQSKGQEGLFDVEKVREQTGKLEGKKKGGGYKSKEIAKAAGRKKYPQPRAIEVEKVGDEWFFRPGPPVEETGKIRPRITPKRKLGGKKGTAVGISGGPPGGVKNIEAVIDAKDERAIDRAAVEQAIQDGRMEADTIQKIDNLENTIQRLQSKRDSGKKLTKKQNRILKSLQEQIAALKSQKGYSKLAHQGQAAAASGLKGLKKLNPVRPLTQLWMNTFDAIAPQIGKKFTRFVMQRKPLMQIVSTFVTRFGQDKLYNVVRTEQQLAEHKLNRAAEDLAAEIDKIDNVFTDISQERIDKARKNTMVRAGRKLGALKAKDIEMRQKLVELNKKKKDAKKRLKLAKKITEIGEAIKKQEAEVRRLADRKKGKVKVSLNTLESRMRQVAEGSTATLPGERVGKGPKLTDKERVARLQAKLAQTKQTDPKFRRTQEELAELQARTEEDAGKFAALKGVVKTYEELEKGLRERGLLTHHQFLDLSKRERAKAVKRIGTINDKISKLYEKLIDAEVNERGKDARRYNSAMKKLLTQRVEMIRRLQVHYKNSGRNYIRILKDKVDRTGREIDRFRNIKLSKTYALRRANWKTKLDANGTVHTQHVDAMRHIPLKKMTYSVRKGIQEEARDMFLYDMFEKIEQNTEWTQPKGKETPGPEWVQIDNNENQYGVLAGRYVQKPIADEILQYTKVVKGWQKLAAKSISKWKAGKTIWNPATQVRNFVSNLILADIIGDLDPLNPANWKYYVNGFRAVAQIRKGRDVGGYANEIKWDTTIQRSTFTKAELDDMGGDNWIEGITGPNEVIDKMLDLTRSGLKKPGQLYSLVEEGMKAAVYMKARDKGLSVRQAEAKAQEALFDYGDVPPAIRWARQGYSPFATFVYKALPALAKNTARRPWKLGQYYGYMFLANSLFQSLMGWSDEEKERDERVLPEQMRRRVLPGMPSHIRIPVKTAEGKSKWLDLSYMLPWGELTETRGDTSMWFRALMPNNPVLNTFYDFVANENVFLEKELVMDHETGGEIYSKFFWHAAEQAAPGLLSPRKIKKMVDAVQGNKDWRGEEYSIAEATLDTLLGIKIRNQDWMTDESFRRSELQEELQSLNNDFIKKHDNIFITHETSWSSEKKAEKMDDLYRWYNEKQDSISDRQYTLVTGKEAKRNE